MIIFVVCEQFSRKNTFIFVFDLNVGRYTLKMCAYLFLKCNISFIIIRGTPIRYIFETTYGCKKCTLVRRWTAWLSTIIWYCRNICTSPILYNSRKKLYLMYTYLKGCDEDETFTTCAVLFKYLSAVST